MLWALSMPHSSIPHTVVAKPEAVSNRINVLPYPGEETNEINGKGNRAISAGLIPTSRHVSNTSLYPHTNVSDYHTVSLLVSSLISDSKPSNWLPTACMDAWDSRTRVSMPNRWLLWSQEKDVRWVTGWRPLGIDSLISLSDCREWFWGGACVVGLFLDVADCLDGRWWCECVWCDFCCLSLRRFSWRQKILLSR